MLDYARIVDNADSAVSWNKRVRDYYLPDHACPVRWEPSGEDFLSGLPRGSRPGPPRPSPPEFAALVRRLPARRSALAGQSHRRRDGKPPILTDST